MKLIFCPECNDILKLSLRERVCECGQSGGKYLPDGIDAIITGKAIPLGIANSSFVKALENRPDEGRGERFEAFVMPHQCATITSKDQPKGKNYEEDRTRGYHG